MPDGGDGRPDGPLGFARVVPPDGYAWWYVDALSDDGHHALTLIAFVGSVFSPWYFAARRRGPADPRDHAALNVALYAPGGSGAPRKRWAFTERRRGALIQAPDSLAIGPSALSWDGAALTVAIAETTVPVPTRLRGTVRLHAGAIGQQGFALDADGRHLWTPRAPRARVEVAFERPALRWSGDGYLDTNHGARPLERDFAAWQWSRAARGPGAVLLYDVVRRDGSRLALAVEADAAGRLQPMAPPPAAPLPPTAWRVARATRADRPGAARVLRTLEDTPFYARSVVATELGGAVTAVHESLSLDRFVSPVVQLMLPFRAPRAWR